MQPENQYSRYSKLRFQTANSTIHHQMQLYNTSTLITLIYPCKTYVIIRDTERYIDKVMQWFISYVCGKEA